MSARRRPAYDTRKTSCPTCYREVRVVVPAGGDGSLEVYYRHTNPGTGERCPEGRQEVRTPVYIG